MQCHEENPAARLTLLLVSAYTAQPRHEFPFRRDFNVETFADCFADYVLRPGDLELCGDPLENSSTYADNAGGKLPLMSCQVTPSVVRRRHLECL
jgi:hypothetical protein